MLDDFCEEAGYCRRHATRVLHQAGQRYLLGEEVLVGGATKRLRRHRPPLVGPAVQKALITIWNASTLLGPVRLAGGMPLFVEDQKGAWASPSGGRDTAASPPDESGRGGKAPGGGEADVSSARDLPYPEHPSGWGIPIQTRMDPPLPIPGVPPWTWWVEAEGKLLSYDAETVRKSLERRWGKLDPAVVKSLTCDQGKEMAQHEALANRVKMKACFCHPHSPWEKGTCENTNDLVGDLLEGVTDFRVLRGAQVTRVADLLHERPRQTLGFKTPKDQIMQLCAES